MYPGQERASFTKSPTVRPVEAAMGVVFVGAAVVVAAGGLGLVAGGIVEDAVTPAAVVEAAGRPVVMVRVTVDVPGVTVTLNGPGVDVTVCVTVVNFVVRGSPVSARAQPENASAAISEARDRPLNFRKSRLLSSLFCFLESFIFISFIWSPA